MEHLQNEVNLIDFYIKYSAESFELAPSTITDIIYIGIVLCKCTKICSYLN